MTNPFTLLATTTRGAVRVTAAPLHASSITLGLVSAATGRAAEGLESTARRVSGKAEPLAAQVETTAHDAEDTTTAAVVSVLEHAEPEAGDDLDPDREFDDQPDDLPDDPTPTLADQIEYESTEQVEPLATPPFVEADYHPEGNQDDQPEAQPGDGPHGDDGREPSLYY
jgi:hypothetical protein